MEDNELFEEPTMAEEVSTTQQAAPLEAEPAAESYDDLAPAQRSTYVRQRAPRRTQEAIDDLAEDDSPVEYAHESNVTIGGSIGDRKYRRARSNGRGLPRSRKFFTKVQLFFNMKENLKNYLLFFFMSGQNRP